MNKFEKMIILKSAQYQPTLIQIHLLTCNIMKIGYKEIFQKGRKRHIVLNRQIFMYVAQKNQHTQVEIGIYAGVNGYGKSMNHATVCHSYKLIENLMSYDRYLKEKVNTILKILKTSCTKEVIGVDLLQIAEQNTINKKNQLFNQFIN